MPQCLNSPTHPLSTEWSYSSPQMGHPFMHDHGGYCRTNCNWPRMNLGKWRSWASSIVRIVSGLHLFTWCPNHRVVGGPAGISDASMTADCYPFPHIQDFTAKLAGARIFSKADLVRGYNQIPVHTDDIPKTAVTPFGLWEFLRRPFGLKNVAQMFQRLMNTVLRGLEFKFVTLDDILVASRSKQEHMYDKCLQQQDLIVINLVKCQFGRQVIDFLNYHIIKHGATPLPSKVAAIREFARPSTVKGLQDFIGMVNFYHRFVPEATSIMQPLFWPLVGKPQKLQWTSQRRR